MVERAAARRMARAKVGNPDNPNATPPELKTSDAAATRFFHPSVGGIGEVFSDVEVTAAAVLGSNNPAATIMREYVIEDNDHSNRSVFFMGELQCIRSDWIGLEQSRP